MADLQLSIGAVTAAQQHPRDVLERDRDILDLVSETTITEADFSIHEMCRLNSELTRPIGRLIISISQD